MDSKQQSPRSTFKKITLLKNGTKESGFTLVEALVSVAITGILAIVLMSVIRQVSVATRSREALASSLTSLNMAAGKMTSNLQNISRQTSNLPPDVQYLFIGIDGDNGWNVTDQSSNRPASNTDVDRLYFHILDSDQALGSSVGSERSAIGYLLSEKQTTLYEQGQWRMYRKRNTHGQTSASNGIMMPATNTAGDDFSTSFKDPGSLGGGAPIGLNIDRLSFRYLQSDGTWVNSWDSTVQGGIPEAVEIGIRSYDDTEPGSPGHLEPQWFVTMVSLGNG